MPPLKSVSEAIMKLSALVCFLLVSANLFSQEIDYSKEKRELQKRKPSLTSKVTHKRLERAFSYARHDKYDQAVKVLVDLLRLTEKRPDEYAQTWQHLGFMLAQKGDVAKAIKALDNSLEAKGLAYAQTLSSLYTLAQLHLSEQRFEVAESIMRRWFGLAEEPSAEAYILMGSILSQVNKKEEALKYVNQAMVTNANPPEKWLQFALALNHELKQYDNSLKILAILTSQYPQNDKYWKQFSSTYLSLGQDAKALAMMELAYKLGFLKQESDLINMASLYVFLGMPQKGAKFLEEQFTHQRITKNFKNYDLLSQAWLMAKEKNHALLALEQASSLAPKGDLFVRKGYIHLEDEAWEEAIKSLSKGLSKGGVKNIDKVYFAIGIAKYNKKDLNGALEALFKARKLNDDDSSIQRWIEQVKTEKGEVIVSQL